jgi:hypothetical protein
MGYSLRKKLGELDLGSVAKCVGQSFLGSVGMAAVAAIVVSTKIGESALQSKLATILLTIVTFMVGMWVYYGLTRLFKMPETAYLDRTVNRIRTKLGRGQQPSNPS